MSRYLPMNVQFRAEAFNLFDQAHFYAPGFSVFSGSAGHITQLVSGRQTDSIGAEGGFLNSKATAALQICV